MGSTEKNGVDLSRLICETRNLATENVELIEINQKCGAELKIAKDNQNRLGTQIEAYKAQIAHFKLERKTLIEKESTSSKRECDVRNKVRSLQEELEVALQRNDKFEPKIKELKNNKREIEERIKLQRSEIFALRAKNDEIENERNCVESRLTMSEECTNRQRLHQDALGNEVKKLAERARDAEDRLSSTRIELIESHDRLNSFTEESRLQMDAQNAVIAEIDKLKDRLGEAQSKNAALEADFAAERGKLKAAEDSCIELADNLSREQELRQMAEKSVENRNEESIRLRQMLESEQESRRELDQRSAHAEAAIRKLNDEMDHLNMILEQERSTNTAEKQETESKYSDEISQLQRGTAEQEATIASLQIELKEANTFIREKDNKIDDQLAKIKGQIQDINKYEICSSSMKNEIAEMKKIYGECDKVADGLQRDLDKERVSGAEKDTEILILTEQNLISQDKREKLESEIEQLRIDLVKVTSKHRDAENSLSELTAEQARLQTQISQLRRHHQSVLTTMEDEREHQNKNLKNQFETMSAEQELLTKEWSKRANKAERKLLVLAKQVDNLSLENKQINEKRARDATNGVIKEIDILKRIERQQNELILQKNILMKQWSLGDRLKKFMRETVVQLDKKCTLGVKKWSSNSPILRFRVAVIVVIASNRMSAGKRKQPETLAKHPHQHSHPDFSFSLGKNNLIVDLNRGLNKMIKMNKSNTELYSTKILAGSFHQTLQRLIDRSNRLEKERNSLRRKIKVNTSFMSELEQRVITIEDERKESF